MELDMRRYIHGQTGDFDEMRILVEGGASYTSDIDFPDQLFAYFLRSNQAHAQINQIDIAQAIQIQGVKAIYTGQDLLKAGIGLIPPIVTFNQRDGSPMSTASMPALAIDRVRYVGEPVAIVIAVSPHIAAKAADLIEIDYLSITAVVSAQSALAPNAPLLHDHLPSNMALDWEDGDAARIDQAFNNAHYIETVELADPPVAACALEPRAAIAHWDKSEKKYTLIAGTQGVMVVRKLLAEHVLKIDLQQLRVLTPNVGGGFGTKVQAYSEYAALLYAAKQLMQPIKWTASRLESFLSDTNGRNATIKASMAFDREGKILGLRTHFYWSIGAYTSTYVAIVTTNNIKNCLSSVYQIPAIYIHSQVAHTNTVPLGPYRGAGRPEAIYLIERLLDKASVKLVIDRIELRRRNMIPSNLMPYTTVNGQIYDSGDFETVMNQALTLSNWATFPDRQKEAAQQGKLRGIGICCFLEVSGGILEEPIEIEFLESGDVCLKVGAQAMGQGHINTLPRIAQAKLGIPLERIRIISGDSQQIPGIVATVASRSMMMVGNAIAKACDEAIIRGKELAAILWNQSAVEIEFIHGHFQTKDKKNQIPLIDITRQIKNLQLNTHEIIPTMSLVTKFTSPTMSYPNGAHVCEVEIDPSTGVTQFIQHTAIDDVGVMLNQEVVEGQIVGAIAQAYGQTLGEYMHYDESGQLMNPSFMDYPIMRADNMPKIILKHHVAPCQNNPLGVKGAGESGIAGALPSSINAILHALGSQGVVDMDLPFTPNRVWDALQKKT